MKRKFLTSLVDDIDGMRRNQPMQYESLTYDIIGCAYKVYNTLGFGFLESIYKPALIVELINAGLQFDVENPCRFIMREKLLAIFASIWLLKIK